MATPVRDSRREQEYPLAKPQYCITTMGNTTVLVMNKNVRELVGAALEIVNPDDEKQEALARQISLDLSF